MFLSLNLATYSDKNKKKTKKKNKKTPQNRHLNPLRAKTGITIWEKSIIWYR
jgi:hypothetical protein